MKVKDKLMMLLAFSAVWGGCSPQARDEYAKAGQEAAQAGTDAGKAAKIDLKKTATAAQAAGDAASKSLKETHKKADSD